VQPLLKIKIKDNATYFDKQIHQFADSYVLRCITKPLTGAGNSNVKLACRCMHLCKIVSKTVRLDAEKNKDSPNNSHIFHDEAKLTAFHRIFIVVTLLEIFFFPRDDSIPI
jgi:hypothetical protein